MCAPRKEGEPWVLYAVRYAAELVEDHARSVLAVIGICAAVWLYTDLRSLILAQTESYREISVELRELNVRVEAIEHRQHTTNHNKEPQVK